MDLVHLTNFATYSVFCIPGEPRGMEDLHGMLYVLVSR